MARWFVDRNARRGIPSVSLRRLLPEARFVGCRDLEVSGCSADSRRLEPGQVFVALGTPDHDDIARALDRGAAAVIVERPCPEAGRPTVVVDDARRSLARIAHALAGDPSARLPVVGIVGPTGRTATATFLHAIFEAAGARFGVVGAAGWSDGVNAHPPGASAPDAESLAAMLDAMIGRECVGAAIEVDAEALGRREVEGIAFDAAIATAVAPPGSEPVAATRARRAAQARLFRLVAPGGLAIVNADDPDADLLSAVALHTHRVSFGLARPADVIGRIERLDAGGTRLRLVGLGREVVADLRPIGSRNASYALAAAALAWSRGLPDAAVVAGLESVDRVPGRLEPAAAGAPFDVRLESARDEAELREALAALRQVTPGLIHCVLGAAAPAQPALARAAEYGADRVVLTLDEPSADDPDALIDELLGGLRRPGRARVQPDRRLAIESALELARPGDAVLIAGRGVYALPRPQGRDLPCGDRDVIAQWFLNAPARQRRSA